MSAINTEISSLSILFSLFKILAIDISVLIKKFELIERDRVLRCWYGQIIPQKLQLPQPLDAKLGMFYHISKYLFRDSADPYYTIGYFGFPKDSEKHPLFFGFGSAASLQTAGRKAADEAITRLSRLWNQPIPHKLPIFAPTANFHQDYFSHPANHEKIREWLSGRNSEQRLFFKPEYKVVKDYAIDYFDITPPEFKKKFFVVKAVSAQAIPLWFGIPDAILGVSSDRISIHPIA